MDTTVHHYINPNKSYLEKQMLYFAQNWEILDL